jgi:hypothetical protein
MRIQTRWFGGLVVALALSGCATAHTQIRPEGPDEFVVVANAPSQSQAYDAAVNDATEHCRKRGRNFLMLEDSRGAQTTDHNEVTVRFQCK